MKPLLVIQQTETEKPALLEAVLNSMQVRYQVFQAWHEGPFPNPSDFQAVIALGGTMGVHDTKEFPWLRSEEEFLRLVVAKSIKLVGICLGGQLLAHSMGGQVKKAAEPEIGWHEVSWDAVALSNDWLAQAIDRLKSKKFMQWHFDSFTPPTNAVVLGSSKSCKFQAFRIGSNAYGFQFHPEASPELLKNWVDGEGTRERLSVLRASGCSFVQEPSTFLKSSEDEKSDKELFCRAMITWLIS